MRLSGKKEEKEEKLTPPVEEKKSSKGLRYRIWSANNIPPPANKYRKPTDKDMTGVRLIF